MIGLVDGSVPATTRRFHVVLAGDAVVQLDDIVVLIQELPNGESLRHYGIVVEGSGIIEGAQFPSDTDRIAGKGTMPGISSRRVEVQVLRTVPEKWIAPSPGAAVSAVSGADRDAALFLDQMSEMLPIGLDQRNQPLYADFGFMNGEKGGHVSISGVSGVATKTSYALFLLYMLFETPIGKKLLGDSSVNARALVFNVKGEDLLHLDRKNVKFKSKPEEQAKWQALGVDAPGPFQSVEFFVPRSSRARAGHAATDVLSRSTEDLTVFGWTPLEFLRKRLLKFAIADAQDSRNQLSFVEQRISSRLAQHAFSVQGRPGAVVIIKGETVNEKADAPRNPGEGKLIEDFHGLVDYLSDILEDENDPDYDYYVGNNSPGTVMAFLRRFQALSARIGHLVSVETKPVVLNKRISVVDLHSLHDDAQRFVVGALVSEIFESKQGTGRDPLRFIVLDELNKYAPKDGHSPVKETFVDVAARGRSLGVLLIGAQQNAANVDRAITTAASLKVVGRLDASTTEDYKFLSPELRERAARFLPGTMIVDQPMIPAPLPLRFPFPAYASCKSEVEVVMDEKAVTDAFQAIQ
jgi:uncharacterized protein